MAYLPQAFVTPQVLAHPNRSATIRIPRLWTAPAGRARSALATPGGKGPQLAGGLGEYERSGNWAYEFFPPPYDFLAPRPGSRSEEYNQMRGLGCAGCAGSCGCSRALGDDTTSTSTDQVWTDPLAGALSSLSSSGFSFYVPFQSTDFSSWGWEEWALIAGGLYMAVSLFQDARSAAGAVRSYSRSRKASKRRKLEAQLQGL